MYTYMCDGVCKCVLTCTYMYILMSQCLCVHMCVCTCCAHVCECVWYVSACVSNPQIATLLATVDTNEVTMSPSAVAMIPHITQPCMMAITSINGDHYYIIHM